MKDIMLDLETMSLTDDAAIISIGAVVFDLFTGEMGTTFYRNVRLNSCVNAGLSVSPETIMWWMQQSSEARSVFDEQKAITLEYACIDFSTFTKEVGVEKEVSLWGNGKEFDNKILRNAYKAVDQSFPLPYYKDCDVRTPIEMARRVDPDWEKPEREGTHHNALDDAIYQVKYLCDAWRTIKSN